MAELDELIGQLSQTTPANPNRMEVLGHRLALNYLSAAVEALDIAADGTWTDQDAARDARVTAVLADTPTDRVHPWP